MNGKDKSGMEVKNREYHLDCMRIFACFMVITVHVVSKYWGKIPITSNAWNVLNFYDAMLRWAVPVFFMLSGYLFLSKPEISIKTLLTKTILRLVFIYYLWSFLYAIDRIGIDGIIYHFDFWRIIEETLNSKYHLWYLPALVSVYLLFPVLWGMKEYKNGKYLNYFCIVWFLFGILCKTILLWPIPSLLETFVKKISFALNGYCGYFVLGYVLSKHKEKFQKCRKLGLAVLFFLMAIITAWLVREKSLQVGSADMILYAGS